MAGYYRLLLVGKKVILVIDSNYNQWAIREHFNILMICCENIVNIALLYIVLQNTSHILSH